MKITFFTTTTFSDIQKIQSECIKKSFSDSKQYLIDGRKDDGIKFKYLEPKFSPEFQTTNLLNDSIIHMWHQRQRNSNNIVSSAHTMSNKERYDGMLEKLRKILDE